MSLTYAWAKRNVSPCAGLIAESLDRKGAGHMLVGLPRQSDVESRGTKRHVEHSRAHIAYRSYNSSRACGERNASRTAIGQCPVLGASPLHLANFKSSPGGCGNVCTWSPPSSSGSEQAHWHSHCLLQKCAEGRGARDASSGTAHTHRAKATGTRVADTKNGWARRRYDGIVVRTGCSACTWLPVSKAVGQAQASS